jgi:hypothetical protein
MPTLPEALPQLPVMAVKAAQAEPVAQAAALLQEAWAD